jgi:hypothetical protein
MASAASLAIPGAAGAATMPGMPGMPTETAMPTDMPMPTEEPTEEPTAAPTEMPTDMPMPTDTAEPTEQPTAAPTATDTPLPAGYKRVTLKYGPFTIPAGSAQREGVFNGVNFIKRPCAGSCDIVEMKPDLVYADGSKADMDTGPMLHHFVISNLNGQDATCPNRIGGQRLFSAGNERTDKALPPGYGIRTQQGNWWFLLTELMNHSTSAKNVQLQVTYTIAPFGSTKSTQAEWLDVTGCMGASFYGIPAGKSTKTWTWTANATGKIVYINGHMHEDGVNILAKNLTTGQTICDAKATYGTIGGMRAVTDMGKCVGEQVAVIHRGDRIQITSNYDSATQQSDVMGIMHAYLAPL